MRVLIIGGSIAGLTLAHCLEKAKIDYVLLEKKEEIAPRKAHPLVSCPMVAESWNSWGYTTRSSS